MGSQLNKALLLGGGSKKTIPKLAIEDSNTAHVDTSYAANVNGTEEKNGKYGGDGSTHEGGVTNPTVMPKVDTSYAGNMPWWEKVVGLAKNTSNNVKKLFSSTVAAVNNATNEPVDTYENYLRKKGAAETQRDNAYTSADAERERSIADARSYYEQNKATYGANAEAMADMGLTGSGYSDYINSQAYAQQREEIQRANAQATSAKRDADYEYASNAMNAYKEFLSFANDGIYTPEQLRQLAKEYGLSEEQTNSLVVAAENYTKKEQDALNYEINANTGNDIAAVRDLVNSGRLSEEQGQQKIDTIQKSNYDSFCDDISYYGSSYDTSIIDRAYDSDKISADLYNSLKSKWNSAVDTSKSAFYNADGSAMLNKSAAQKEMDKITNNPWCSDATKKALQDTFNSLYTITKEVRLYTNGGKSGDQKTVRFNNGGSSDDLAELGNNFSVICDDEKYRIESGGEVTDTNIKEMASDLSNGTVFGYNEKLYIKKDGRFFEIKSRPGLYNDDYDSLYKLFFV